MPCGAVLVPRYEPLSAPCRQSGRVLVVAVWWREGVARGKLPLWAYPIPVHIFVTKRGSSRTHQGPLPAQLQAHLQAVLVLCSLYGVLMRDKQREPLLDHLQDIYKVSNRVS